MRSLALLLLLPGALALLPSPQHPPSAAPRSLAPSSVGFSRPSSIDRAEAASPLLLRHNLRGGGSKTSTDLSASMAAFTRMAPMMGVIIGNIQCAIPIRNVIDVRRTGRVGELNTLVYVSLVANNLGWMLYGMVVKDKWIFATSISQGLMSLFYAVSCHPHSPPETQRKVITFSLIYAAVYAAAGAGIALIPSKLGGAASVLGAVAQGCCIAYYSTPFVVLKKVIEAKDSASIEPVLTCVSMFHASLWLVYGAGNSDFWLLVSSTIGCSLQALFLVVWAMYRRGPSLKRT